MFQCHFPKSSHPLPLPQSKKLFYTSVSLLLSHVHGIFEARILEWVAISSSRGSSQPRYWTWVSCVSCVSRRILYHWATWCSTSLHWCKGSCLDHQWLIRCQIKESIFSQESTFSLDLPGALDTPHHPFLKLLCVLPKNTVFSWFFPILDHRLIFLLGFLDPTKNKSSKNIDDIGI